MDPIDKALRALAAAPEHPELSGIDARVLDRINARPTPRLPMRSVLAVVVAAAIGTAAGYAPMPYSDTPALILDSGTSLAPSTLLAGS